MTRSHILVNLNNITHNIEKFRRLSSPKTKVIGVVKANAYGHGAVPVSRHLKNIGETRTHNLEIGTMESRD